MCRHWVQQKRGTYPLVHSSSGHSLPSSLARLHLIPANYLSPYFLRTTFTSQRVRDRDELGLNAEGEKNENYAEFTMGKLFVLSDLSTNPKGPSMIVTEQGQVPDGSATFGFTTCLAILAAFWMFSVWFPPLDLNVPFLNNFLVSDSHMFPVTQPHSSCHPPNTYCHCYSIPSDSFRCHFVWVLFLVCIFSEFASGSCCVNPPRVRFTFILFGSMPSFSLTFNTSCNFQICLLSFHHDWLFLLFSIDRSNCHLIIIYAPFQPFSRTYN